MKKFITVLLFIGMFTAQASDYVLGNAYFKTLEEVKLKLDNNSIEVFNRNSLKFL